MQKRKNMIIILISAVCLSFLGMLLIIAYEREQEKKEIVAAYEKSLEDQYYENSNELGITEDKGALNGIYRGLNKITNQDRRNKLASSILAEYYYLINEQRLDDAYNLLNEDYINEFRINSNVFKAMNNGVKVTDYTITDISEPNSDGIILLSYLIKGDKGYTSKYMSIIEDKYGYSITLNGISEITKLSIEENKEGLKLSVTKRYKIGSRIAYKLDLENTTDKDINIKMHPKGIYGLIQTNKYDHEIANTLQPFVAEDYLIKSGENQSHIIMFNASSYLEKIGIELENGQKLEFKLIDI